MNEQSKTSPIFIMPILMTANVDALSSFYQKAFDFKSILKIKNLSERVVTEVLVYGDSKIIIREEGQFELKEVSPKKSNTPSPIDIVLMCDDVDKRCEIAKANGAEVIFPPKIMPWESRMCKLRDPEGYIWYFERWKDGFIPSNDSVPVVQSH